MNTTLDRRLLKRKLPSWKNMLMCFITCLLCITVLYPFRLFHMLSQSHGNTFTLFAGERSVLGCLTKECVHELSSRVARIYPARTNRTWCISGKRNDNVRQTGIILVKVPKGASSTSAGVAIRISRRLKCNKVRWMHKMGYQYKDRLRGRSFLFTTIRDPAARAVSSIFFHVISRQVVNATDELIIRSLKAYKDDHYGAISDGQGGFQLRYIAPQTIPQNYVLDNFKLVHPELVLDLVQKTLQHYDFIIVTERMDESLVAMALLLGIDVGDVLVTASKVAGSRYHFAHMADDVYQCVPTVKSFISPAVKEYLESDQWRAANYGDYLLHQAAVLSLERTIDQIGRNRFDAALANYRRLQVLEEIECAPYVKFPCSDEGEPQPKLSRESCYLPFYDFGCGYKCIDQMIERVGPGLNANISQST